MNTNHNKLNELEKARTAMINVMEDIQAEKIKAQTLAQELKKFQLAVEGAFDQIVITDPEGIVVYANKTVEKLTGYTAEEVVGYKAGKLWGGFMPKSFYEKMWRTIKIEKKHFVGEIKNKKKNGDIYDAEIHISPVIDDSGTVVFFVAIERDITRAKEIDRAKTEFVSLASHQLRTPLTSISWYCELLMTQKVGPLNAVQLKYLEEIYTGNKRLVGLVDALLNVSRIEMGTLAMSPVPTDLIKIVNSVLSEVKLQIEAKHLKVVEKHDQDCIVSIDPKFMRIVYQNLLTNAVKYTPNNGTVSITHMISKKNGSDDHVIIKVSDTGYGVPESQKNKIFDKLFRADNVRTIDTKGSGLGLYITKSIIEQSNGTISFESTEGKGTTFIVTLPLKSGKNKIPFYIKK